jgi:sugar phosphate permease
MTSEVLRRGRTTSLKAWQLRIFAITWLAYAGFYLTRKSLSVAKIELKKPEVWGLSTETLAAVDGGYLIADAAGQFLWGVLGDRVGTRRVVLAGMAGSVAVAVAMGSAATAAWLGVLFAHVPRLLIRVNAAREVSSAVLKQGEIRGDRHPPRRIGILI